MPTKPPTYRPPGLAEARHEAAQAYERRRGSARERGYTAAWSRAAADHRRHHPLCVGCQARGRYVPATLVDHVVPHDGDAVLFWDRSNWQSSCTWCHSVLKQALERAWRAGRLALAALRLDSAEAVALARRLRGEA